MFDDFKITLASNSPRRRELLAGLDINFTVEANKDEKEAYTADLPWDKIPEYLALHKSETFHRKLEKNEILITADTLVFLPVTKEGSSEMIAIGKPCDKTDAQRILRLLSGHTHSVLTGVVIRTNDKNRSFTSFTEVTFRELCDNEIDYYIDKYRPYDKAGAYGVQEWIG